MPGTAPTVDLLSKGQAAAELQRVQQRRAADAAYEAELICRLADLSPDDTDSRCRGSSTPTRSTAAARRPRPPLTSASTPPTWTGRAC